MIPRLHFKRPAFGENSSSHDHAQAPYRLYPLYRRCRNQEEVVVEKIDRSLGFGKLSRVKRPVNGITTAIMFHGLTN
jgi:hypothetical protein